MERIVIEIVGDTTKLQSTIDQLQKLGQVDNQNAKTFQSNNKKTNQAINQTTKDVGYLNNQIQNLGNTIAGAFAVGALVQFGKQAVQTSAQIDSITKSLEFITGGSKQAAATMEYLKSLSNKLGLEFVSTAQAFKLFAGATTQAGMTLGQTKSIFESVSKAVTTMGLSAEDANGVFLALSQIMSKGKVSAEELRGQIGERIPGAFSIAAKSIGVTEQQLNKMLEQGQVISKDFLPKFAKQLEKDLGGGAENAANSLSSALNRIQNSFTELFTRVGNNLAPFVKKVSDALQELTGEKANAELAKAANKQFEGIIQGIEKTSDFAELRIIKAQQVLQEFKDNLEQAQVDERNAQQSQKPFFSKRIAEYTEMIKLLDAYDGELIKVEKTENKSSQATEENNKKKEKQLSAYERLIKAASDLEAAMRNTLALNGIVSPKAIAQLDDLKMKIQTIEIAMKNLNDPLLKSAGGKPLGVTSDLPNELPTGDFGEAAQKAEYDALLGLHEDFLSELDGSEEQYMQKWLSRKAKQEEIEKAFYANLPELASEAINTIMQLQQLQLDWEFNLLETQVANKEITEKEYEQKRKVLLRRQAEQEKQAAIFQATISMANAILKALESGPIIGPIMAAIIGALGIAQVAAISAAPLPQYAEGTEFVSLGKNKKGKDTIPAMLNEGEAVIKTNENSKYPGLAKAWNEGKLEDYVMSNFMLPMINPKSYELEQQKSFAENVANSIVLNQDFGTLESKLKKIEQAEREGAVYLGKKIEKAINNQSRGGF